MNAKKFLTLARNMHMSIQPHAYKADNSMRVIHRVHNGVTHVEILETIREGFSDFEYLGNPKANFFRQFFDIRKTKV